MSSNFGNLYSTTHRAQREARAKRRALIAQLILQRKSIARIAEEAGCSLTVAKKDIKAIRTQWAAELNPEDKSRWRLQQLMKLDQLEGTIEELVYSSDSPDETRVVSDRTRLKAAETLLKIISQRTELLGLRQLADGEADALKAANTPINTFNTLVVIDHRDSPSQELPPMIRFLDEEVPEAEYVSTT